MSDCIFCKIARGDIPAQLLYQDEHVVAFDDVTQLVTAQRMAAWGDVARRIMRAHPTTQLLMLCGHTHGGGEFKALDNLHVSTGEARYGSPTIQRIVEVQ